jgi:hypothetical protein
LGLTLLLYAGVRLYDRHRRRNQIG